MTARANFQNNILHLVGAILLMLLMFTLFSSAQASARTLDQFKNEYERTRKDLCFTDPANYSIYGVVWVNNNAPSTAGDARWSIDLTVPWDATVIGATMWTTAANCPDGATRTNARIFNLAPAGGGSVPLDFPFGNSINRGDSTPGTFADPPGAITVRLDVTGKAAANGVRDCNHTVAYVGTYADSRGTGASNVFVNQLCITRQARPQPNWTQVVSSSVTPSTLQPGQTATFTHNMRNNGPDHSRDWIYITRYKNKDASGRILQQGDIAAITNTSGTANLAPGASVNRVDSFVMPSTWTAGFQRCEYILIDSYRSPIPNPSELRSTEVCATVATSTGADPVGTISTTCTSSTQGRVTITFNDPNGATDAYITVGGSPPYATATTTPYSYNGVPIPASGSVSIQLFVRNVGTGGFNQYKNVSSGTLSNANCAPPSLEPSCVSPQDTVTLPTTPRPSPSSGYSDVPSAPSGSTTQGGARVATLAPGAGFRINTANDQYSSPTSATWSPGGRQASNIFTLNYNNYVTQYPYDSHDTTVGYTEWWSEQRYYTNSTPDFYTCDPGDSLSGRTCTHFYTETTSGTRTCTFNQTTGRFDCTPYTCPSGYSGGGTSSTCSRPASNTYTATSNYNWRTGSTAERPSNSSIGVGQGGITRLPECYQRTFNVHSMTDPIPTTAGVTMTPDAEDPTTAAFNSTVVVDFGYDPAATSPAGLRNANRVTLNWTASYYIVQAGEPTDPANGDPFTVACSAPGLQPSGSVTVNGRNSRSDNESASISIRPCNANSFLPPLRAGDRVCVALAITPKGSRINQLGVITTNDGVVVRTHNCGPILADQPYVHIRGLDVSAGGSFANGMLDKCVGAPQNPGRIIANLKNAGQALAKGSGSQYGALSIGVPGSSTPSITGFASASHRNTTPNASGGLSFSNADTIRNPRPLGNFGGQHCIPDFYSAMPPADRNVAGAYNLANLNGNRGKEVVSANGDLRLTFPGGPSTGIREGNLAAVYVNGDVYIEDNIRFRDTVWASKADVPSFFLVATGDIFIAPGVDRIDGVLVAQGGTINTCANNFGSFAADQLYDSCNDRQLTVNGALIANQVRFLRTFASLRNAQSGELPTIPSTSASCAVNTRTTPSRPANYNCAAEIINFSPEIYLSEPAMLPIGGPAVGKYDYITSLSPVL